MKRFLIIVTGIILTFPLSACGNATIEEVPTQETIATQAIPTPRKPPSGKTLARRKLPDAKIFDIGMEIPGVNATQIIYVNNVRSNDFDEVLSQWYLKGIKEVQQPPAEESLTLTTDTQKARGVTLLVERLANEEMVNQLLESNKESINQNNFTAEKYGTSFALKEIKNKEPDLKEPDLTGSVEINPAWEKVEPSPNLIFFGYLSAEGFGYSMNSFFNVVRNSENYFAEYSEDDRNSAIQFLSLINLPHLDEAAQINDDENSYAFILQREIDNKNLKETDKANLSLAFLKLDELQKKGKLKNLKMEMEENWLRFSYKVDIKTIRRVVGI